VGAARCSSLSRRAPPARSSAAIRTTLPGRTGPRSSTRSSATSWPTFRSSTSLSTWPTVGWICEGVIAHPAAPTAMLKTLRKICQVGVLSEPPPKSDELLRARHALDERIRSVLGRALCIRHVDAGSCNGCELEIQALNNPYYNLEGLGIRFVASPRHADMLLVTGPV